MQASLTRLTECMQVGVILTYEQGIHITYPHPILQLIRQLQQGVSC